jgi:LacI family transcriptional regulator
MDRATVGDNARPRPVRLKDIAERTGFSINTVSVALRGGEKVPRSTRQIILAAAEELNYLPNALARSLARKRSRTIGLILSNLLNPTLTLCAQMIERQLEQHGYRMMLVSSEGSIEREKLAIDSLLEHQVEGILMYPANQLQLDHLASLRRAGLPIVTLSGGASESVDLVSIDDRAGTFKLTNHLIELGHRRFGFVDVGHSNGNLRKLAGFRQALEAAGVPLSPDLVLSPNDRNTPACGYRSAGHFFEGGKPKVTAIVTSSDPIAIGVMRWCHENGISVPETVSIAGFDDIETGGYLDVPLTTVGYSTQAVSQHAVTRMISLLDTNGDLGVPLSIQIEPNLVVRASTARAVL